VVSLVCSLAVTASAASLSDYTDVDDITYVEAVDVLTGVGILEGSDGAFNATDTMTRAEAAKIIAYLALGAETASALSATSAPFDDVPLTHWAVGYIAYCASAGIINGDGTGNFNPEADVTAYEFGKMLLCTLGYGVNDEYTGASWAVTIAADAGSLGIYSGKNGSLSGNTAITRDEMALYTFNTLVGAAQVRYNSNFGEYYVGTSALNSISTTIKDSYTYDTYIDGDNDDTAYIYTIGYQTYDLCRVEADGGNDAFGRPAYTWESDGSEISDQYVRDDADYSYTGKVEAQDLYSDFGRSMSNTYTYTVIEDGVDVTSDWLNDTNKTALVRDDGTLTVAKQYSSLTIAGRGSTLDVYVEDEDDTVIIINTYLGQVTDVDDDGDITLSVDVYTGTDSADGYTIDSDTASNLAGFSEDDYVLCTIADDELQSVTSTTTVSGAATAYASSSTTIDGTKYNHSAKCYMMGDRTDSEDYDFVWICYLDGQGNIIGFDSDEDSTSSATTRNYLLVEDSALNAYSALNGAASARVAVTFTDGSESVINLRVTNSTDSDAYFTISGLGYGIADGDTAISTSTTSRFYLSGFNSGDSTDGDAGIPEGIYSYSVNSSGYYTLTAIRGGTYQNIDTGAYITATSSSSTTAGTAVGVTVTDESSRVTFTDASGETTKYASSSTQLVLVDDARTYTGYTNFPDKTYDDNWVLYTLTSSGGTRLRAVYVFDDASASAELTYALYNSYEGQTEDGYEYSFRVNGASVTYTFDSRISGASKFRTAGFIDVDTDGTATFYSTDELNTSSVGSNGYYYDSDNYMYYGTVVDSGSDYIYVNFTGNTDSDGELVIEAVFGIGSDAETTRITNSGGTSSSKPSDGDTVYVFLDEIPSDGTQITGEAVAVISVSATWLANN
ncbi:MAG: S-layer homology domain-containing protein, partial [Oscillospiraceae bacterium]|nr:S-layer homology domain-containing protein [Oscillospiraceae bacterium]